jgi:hypothetical protein
MNEQDRFLDNLSSRIYGRTRTDSIAHAVCVFCGGPATEFTDDVSTREFSITGMCQRCQDKFFVEDEE